MGITIHAHGVQRLFRFSDNPRCKLIIYVLGSPGVHECYRAERILFFNFFLLRRMEFPKLSESRERGMVSGRDWETDLRRLPALRQ
jgi:hypothetical protein